MGLNGGRKCKPDLNAGLVDSKCTAQTGCFVASFETTLGIYWGIVRADD